MHLGNNATSLMVTKQDSMLNAGSDRISSRAVETEPLCVMRKSEVVDIYDAWYN